MRYGRWNSGGYGDEGRRDPLRQPGAEVRFVGESDTPSSKPGKDLFRDMDLSLVIETLAQAKRMDREEPLLPPKRVRKRRPGQR